MLMVGTVLSVALAAAAQTPAADPIAVFLTRSAQVEARPGKEELKALSKERKAAMDAQRRVSSDSEMAMRKQYGGDFKKWPADAKNRLWDLQEETARVMDEWRKIQGSSATEKDLVEGEKWVRGDLAKKKVLRLVDTPAEADLVIDMVSFSRFKITAGPSLRPLPPDRLDSEPLRSNRNAQQLDLFQRYKADSPQWVVLCAPQPSQAHVLEDFVKANADLLRAARQKE